MIIKKFERMSIRNYFYIISTHYIIIKYLKPHIFNNIIIKKNE